MRYFELLRYLTLQISDIVLAPWFHCNIKRDTAEVRLFKKPEKT